MSLAHFLARGLAQLLAEHPRSHSGEDGCGAFFPSL